MTMVCAALGARSSGIVLQARNSDNYSNNNPFLVDSTVSEDSMCPPGNSSGSTPPSPALGHRVAASLPHGGGLLRHQQRSPPTALPAHPGRSQPLSASIPLPKSHIHRTPSELQLVDNTRRAEFENLRMYARLVAGMRSQGQGRGCALPPPTPRPGDVRRADGGWALGRSASKDGEDNGAAADAPRLVRTPSEGSLVSNPSGDMREGPEDVGDDDDEGVFSLEL